MSDVIAIVGRPNVGKSALFNRIAGRRIAIVHDQPGVTRDRISAEIEWRGRPLTLVDTGGIGLVRGEQANDLITSAAMEQVRLAIEAAQVIVLVVNVQEGVVPLDREVADRLRRSGKPVVVAVNKVDSSAADADTPAFAELGFERLFPVSAIHGYGLPKLMNACLGLLPPPSPPLVEAPTMPSAGVSSAVAAPGALRGPFKLAVVGRPNVGKSSLVNALTRSDRVVVSPVPGTTRDAVDVPFEVVTAGVAQPYVLIDTAGIRKTRRVSTSVEFFSVKRAEQSIERCDLAVLVLDAEAGILEQDKKIADRIVENHKACVVVVNKWDLAQAQLRQARQETRPPRRNPPPRKPQSVPAQNLAEFGRWVQERLFFLDYAPVIFASAKAGFALDRVLEAVRYVAAQLRQQIPTALLNRTLQDAIERRQPVSATGRRLKFFYATQVRQAPPTFLLFVNHDEPFSGQYSKHLEDELRRAFGFEGCPIVLVPKPRPKTVASKRSRSRN